jgi:hypothetical protein
MFEIVSGHFKLLIFDVLPILGSKSFGIDILKNSLDLHGKSGTSFTVWHSILLFKFQPSCNFFDMHIRVNGDAEMADCYYRLIIENTSMFRHLLISKLENIVLDFSLDMPRFSGVA